MTFLPIVARELRGASRRRGTYWIRTLVATLALLSGVVIFIALPGTPGAQSGRIIFQGLSGLALFCCLLAGRSLTVDCLSSEKRDGTLGLLFLTDLKGYDVVLGKLAATSLNGFYALLAVMPVLAFSMLLGGVGHQEFWRMVLVLADTFLFSLTLGIFCSAISHDARRAASANFAILLILVGSLPALMGIVAYFVPGHPFIKQFFYACPAFPFYLSFDANYKLNPADFWRATGLLHALTWLFVLSAGWIIPRTWQDKPSRSEKRPWRSFWQAWIYGPAGDRAAHRKRLLDVNAFYWLAARARLKPLHVWIFLGLMGGWWIWGRLSDGTSWLNPITLAVLVLILNSTLKLWVALEAGQQLGEDQRMGTLELMLPTPLTAPDILRGQWLALRRQFLRPLLVVVVAELILLHVTVGMEFSDRQLIESIVAGGILLFADSWALGWVAMRQALTARTPTRAILGTVTRILLVPWILFGLVRLMHGAGELLWPDEVREPGWRFNLGWWFWLGIGTDLFFGLTARHQLLQDFRRFAMHRFDAQPSRLGRWFRGTAEADQPAIGVATQTGETRPPIRFKRWKRMAIAFAMIAVLVGVGVLVIPRKSKFKYPPPVIVSIAQSNSPLIILPGQTTLLALPDGSMWRWGSPGGWAEAGHGQPEQIGSGYHWAQMAGSYYAGAGLQTDGTLWEWRTGGSWEAIPMETRGMPEGSSNSWVKVSSAGPETLALQKDGSIWAWTNSNFSRGPARMGNSPKPSLPGPVQVGTNHDWIDVACRGNFNLAIRSDGTLWGWGRGMSTVLPAPTQLCRETNWNRLGGALLSWYGVNAWTTSGNLWELPVSAHSAESSVASVGRLMITNSGPDRLAYAAFSDGSSLRAFQVRDDGTLWQTDAMRGINGFTPGKIWQQVGTNSNWVSVRGMNGTAIGLTGDGTIWIWGIDWSRKPEVPFSARLKALQDGIADLFSKTATAGPGGIQAVQPSQDTPRPLMRLIMPAAAPTNGSGGR